MVISQKAEVFVGGDGEWEDRSSPRARAIPSAVCLNEWCGSGSKLYVLQANGKGPVTSPNDSFPFSHTCAPNVEFSTTFLSIGRAQSLSSTCRTRDSHAPPEVCMFIAGGVSSLLSLFRNLGIGLIKFN